MMLKLAFALFFQTLGGFFIGIATLPLWQSSVEFSSIAGVLQSSGNAGAAGLMFFLVFWMLKDRRKELREKDRLQFVSTVQIASVIETYFQRFLSELGVSVAERDRLRTERVKWIENGEKAFPNRDSDKEEDK